MIINNKSGRIVLRIGETFEYDGDVYRCEAYKETTNTDTRCDHCALQYLGDACSVLECCRDGRIDEEYVVFVKVEGGEDERK